MVSMNEILAENFAPSQWLSWPRSSLRVVDWNIDRGLKLPAIIDFLADTNADVFILQEVDINAHRTHRLNIAREIARKLRVNYVFGREFVELTQGTKTSPAYHGQTTFSRWKISNPRLIHFQRQSDFWKPRWFKPNLQTFQERLGGRVALAAEINIAGASTLCYNLHLESRFNVCIAQPSPSLPNVSQTVVRRPYDTARSSSLPAHTVAAISMAWVSASWGRTVASGRAFQISSVVGGVSSMT